MATDKNYDLTLDISPLDELDAFALLACQSRNLGNTTDWFGTFRGGLYGFNARIYGVVTHNKLVHSWLPLTLRIPAFTDYHVASILFNMDSAIECFAFMLNALGYAAQPDHFRDVTIARSLSRIAPKDVIGKYAENGPCKPQVKGYALVFPSLQTHWMASRSLIYTIMEHHNVSKHRHTVYSGGMMQRDPPTGLYEALKVQNDLIKKTLLPPMAEILLRSDPKTPRVNRIATEYEDRVILEDIVNGFCTFINESCVLARDDARNRIKLKSYS